MSKTRDQVSECVRSDPGIHFNELVRTLDLAPGQVQYHTRKLVRSETLVKSSLYGKTHYYPPDYDGWERRCLALLRRETAADIVACLMDDSPMRPVEITEQVGIARSTLSWHTDRLVAADIVEKRRDGTLLLSLIHPERTARLLREADPSLSTRLVDRFTRLVDNLLAE
jgi:predicted transcriptional regulator